MKKTYKGKSLEIGGGGRFMRLEDVLTGKGVRNPSGLAAEIGRRKYYQARFQRLSNKGLRKGKGK